MGWGSQAIRSIAARVPRPILLPLLAAVLAYAGYAIVQTARFEYAYWAAGKALDREDFDQAGEHLALCLQLQPNSGRARFRAAQTARRSDQPELAQEQLAVCAEQSWPPATIELEQMMLVFQRGEGDGAMEQLLRKCAAAENPDRFQALEALAKGYVRTYRLLPALQCLDDWIAGRPDSREARMRRGWVYDRLDRFADAEADYRVVIAARPNDIDAKLRLAQILRQEGKTAEAATVFEELVQAGAQAPAITLGLAQTYRDLGRTAEAWRLLDAADESSPDDFAVLLEKGKLCLAEGRDQDARLWLERAAALSPGEHDAHYQLFICLSRLGDTEEAARAEKRFKEIEADLTRVGKLAEQLHNRPNDPDIRFEIAEVFGRRGEESEATRWLEEVVRLNPSHRQARQTLAEYYERLGKAERARIHRKALAKAGG